MRSVTAILVAGLAGQLSSAVVGILPWPVLPLSAALLVVAARTGLRADDQRSALLRKGASAAALVVTLVGVPRLIGVSDLQQVKGSLGLLLVGVQVCQAVGWRAARERRAGIFTALGVLVLAASYSPDVLVGAPLLVGWVALLIALGQHQGCTLRQLLPVTGVAVVLGLVAFLLVPAPVSAGVRSRLASRGGAAAPSASRDSQGATAFSGERLDLRSRGALSSEAVLEVPSDSPVLWRSASFDSYDGTSWTRPHATDVPLTGTALEVSTPTGPTRTDTAVLRTPFTDGVIWSPGLITQVETDRVTAAAAHEDGEVQLFGTAGSYTVTSDAPVTDPRRLQSSVGDDAEEQRWRTLPVTLPDRVTLLAHQLTAGVTNRWDAAQRVAAWLQTHATYRLDSPVPAVGQDAVDRFLFVDRTGFCEQFASAEAVLLRAVGIPARLVTGLAYGTPEGGHRLYRGKDLHAWVELWVPGTGWVASDPTAGVPLAAGASNATLRSRVSAALTAGLRRLTRVPGGRAGLALGLLLAAALVALAVVKRPRRTARAARQEVVAGPALAAFLRLDERLGANRRRGAESLRELRNRVSPELGAALEVVEQECYAATPPDPQQAVEVLDRY